MEGRGRALKRAGQLGQLWSRGTRARHGLPSSRPRHQCPGDGVPLHRACVDVQLVQGAAGLAHLGSKQVAQVEEVLLDCARDCVNMGGWGSGRGQARVSCSTAPRTQTDMRHATVAVRRHLRHAAHGQSLPAVALTSAAAQGQLHGCLRLRKCRHHLAGAGVGADRASRVAEDCQLCSRAQWVVGPPRGAPQASAGTGAAPCSPACSLLSSAELRSAQPSVSQAPAPRNAAHPPAGRRPAPPSCPSRRRRARG